MLRREDWARWRGDTLANINREYLHELAGELLEMGAVVAGFKLGEKGIYLRTAGSHRAARLAKLPVDIDDWSDRELYQAAFEVEVAGTTGAGDSAYAGFLAAMLKGLPPHACIQLASAVGACNVESIDATSGVRSWEETTARLESGWQTRKNFF
jgi:sugar/nucleoside kinase (ribokinase family)